MAGGFFPNWALVAAGALAALVVLAGVIVLLLLVTGREDRSPDGE
jgi:multisubunit Na+/H+ antiporter MnhB subunit